MADRRFYDFPDGRLSAVHFNAEAGAPRIVFLNANGFHGLAYRQILEPMGVHTIALDLRGHGQSELPTAPEALKNWYIFRDDIIHFFGAAIDSPVVLAGHSFGAVSGILASGSIRDKLSGYVGFDPVTIPFLARHWPYIPGGRALMKRVFQIAKNAGRRRHVFTSSDAAFERYQGRGAFRDVPDSILRDYLAGGLKPHKEGVQLACHPRWEQAVYVAQGQNIYKGARGLPDNSRIIYSGKSPVSDRFTRGKIARIIGREKVHFERNYHHLFPFHHPEAARKTLIETLSTASP